MVTRSKGLLAWSLVVLVGVLLFVHRFDSVSRQGLGSFLHNDFNHYYLSSCIAVDSPGKVYRTPLSDHPKSSLFSLDDQIPSPTNPPPLLLATMPLCQLSPLSSWKVWLSLNLSCLIISGLIVCSLMGLKPKDTFAVMSIFLLSSPVYHALFYSQVSSIITLLILCSILSLRKERMVLGGVLLGIALALKFIGWPLIVFALFWRKYRYVVSTVLTFSLLALIPMALFSTSIWFEWYSTAVPIIIETANHDRLNIGILVMVANLAVEMGIGDLYVKPIFVLLILGYTGVLINHARLKSVGPLPLLFLMGYLSFSLSVTVWWHYMVLPSLLLALAMVTQRGHGLRPLLISCILGILLLSNMPLSEKLLYFLSPGVVQTIFILIWAFLPFAAIRAYTQTSKGA